MAKYDASNTDLFVYVRCEPGTLLARLGHHLKLRAAEFSIDADLDHGALDVWIDPASLQPVDAVKWQDKQETGELRPGERREITRRMQRDVLDVAAFPSVEFHAWHVDDHPGGWHVAGELELHGEAKPVEFDIRRRDGRALLETSLDHTSWGIAPYSTMMGGLKVATELWIAVDAPLDPRHPIRSPRLPTSG